jgi:hypothetical protein
MTISASAVTKGMLGGVTIGEAAGSSTKRAAKASSETSAPKPMSPATSEALHTRSDNELARQILPAPCGRVARSSGLRRT